jgi:hypothetical protein
MFPIGLGATMQLRVTSRTLASAVAAIGGLALLAGCAPSTISQDDFISAAADHLCE